jgi:uncharacterized protein YodC (DUF2158 family)
MTGFKIDLGHRFEAGGCKMTVVDMTTDGHVDCGIVIGWPNNLSDVNEKDIFWKPIEWVLERSGDAG